MPWHTATSQSQPMAVCIHPIDAECFWGHQHRLGHIIASLEAGGGGPTGADADADAT